MSEPSPGAKRAAEAEIYNGSGGAIEGCEPVGYYVQQTIDTATEGLRFELEQAWSIANEQKQAIDTATAKLRERLEDWQQCAESNGKDAAKLREELDFIKTEHAIANARLRGEVHPKDNGDWHGMKNIPKLREELEQQKQAVDNLFKLKCDYVIENKKLREELRIMTNQCVQLRAELRATRVELVQVRGDVCKLLAFANLVEPYVSNDHCHGKSELDHKLYDACFEIRPLIAKWTRSYIEGEQLAHQQPRRWPSEVPLFGKPAAAQQPSAPTADRREGDATCQADSKMTDLASGSVAPLGSIPAVATTADVEKIAREAVDKIYEKFHGALMPNVRTWHEWRELEHLIASVLAQARAPLVEALEQVANTVPRFKYVLLDQDGRDIWLHDFIRAALTGTEGNLSPEEPVTTNKKEISANIR